MALFGDFYNCWSSEGLNLKLWNILTNYYFLSLSTKEKNEFDISNIKMLWKTLKNYNYFFNFFMAGASLNLTTTVLYCIFKFIHNVFFFFLKIGLFAHIWLMIRTIMLILLDRLTCWAYGYILLNYFIIVLLIFLFFCFR